MSKKTAIILGVVLVLAVAAVIWMLWGADPETNNNINQDGGDVPIMSESDEKIVYTTDQETDVEALRQDCRQRGGVFNTCGSICPPEAEMCAEVCAFTCELDSGNGSQDNGDFEAYRNDSLGFSVEYRQDMDIQRVPGEDRIKFQLMGPTQREATEFYDGINFTVSRNQKSAESDLREAAEGLLPQEQDVGEVVSGLATTTVNGVEGYTFETSSLGQITHVILPAQEDGDYFHINYLAPDPENRGYEQVVERMLSSFSILDSAETALIRSEAEAGADQAGTIRLNSSDGGPGRGIAAKKTESGKTALSIIAEIPALPEGGSYQAWISSGNSTKPLGNLERNGTVYTGKYSTSEDLSVYSRILVTVEDKPVLTGKF